MKFRIGLTRKERAQVLELPQRAFGPVADFAAANLPIILGFPLLCLFAVVCGIAWLALWLVTLPCLVLEDL